MREAARRARSWPIRREPVPPALLEAAFGEIMDGKASPVAIAALLVALRTKGETVDEIVAAARALRARADGAPAPDPRAIDTCGTGGDGAGTFNVSTAAAFVVAGAGVPVAKHGNRAASSRAGSVDVLEALGVRVDLPIARAAEIVREIGIGFLFARRAHPAMRHVAAVREELGIRTLMNCLGPLLNPVRCAAPAGRRLRARTRGAARARARAARRRAALVVHGSDGLDEITTTGPDRRGASARAACVETLADRRRRPRHRTRALRAAARRRRRGERAHRARRAGRRAGPAARHRAAQRRRRALGGGRGGRSGGRARARAQSVDSGAARAKLAALVERSRR